ncbi:MAG TPA: hypothetical protein VFT13_13430, partial [Candidatus Krumholzibacteria bacterium]|nr:hypothetical protein [Candidatus Krumholzibacteria bacterium]
MARRMRSSLLILLIASFALGWRADPPAYFHPISMTLDASRLFVSDAGAGVRIYDVADPATPAQTAL